MTFLTAAIRAAAPSASPEPSSTPPSVEIRDIALPADLAPPVDLYALTALQLALIVGAGVLLLGLLVWWLARRRSGPPALPPPTPRQIALASLARLRERVQALDAYAFSIAVSEVLRTFVEGQYRLRALQQTSPEFLASIAGAPSFTADDRQLLGAFLERCDMIKFARVEAGVEASETLLGSASAFVEGARG